MKTTKLPALYHVAILKALCTTAINFYYSII